MQKKIEENLNNILQHAYIPELGDLKSGKVRDCHFKDDVMYMVSSDRISCFDVILNQCIPYKGQVLNETSRYFFRNLPTGVNHVVKNALPVENPIDPNLMLVEKCDPIRIELVVRNYLTGSMWRDYEKGKRTFSGIKFKDGLKQYQQLEELFINPTSKAEKGHDEEVDEKKCVDIISKQLKINEEEAHELYFEMKKQATAVFERGIEVASRGDLVLVDTKYEFGMTKDKKLVLIDEVHTPDSSRYWMKEDYKKGKHEEWSKEFVRQHLLSKGFKGDGAVPNLTKDVIIETSKRYIDIYERLVGRKFEFIDFPIQQRLVHNLKKIGHIKGGLAVIVIGSSSDIKHCKAIEKELEKYDIPVELKVASVHRSPSLVEKLVEKYNKSIEPLVLVSVAGGTDALSGTLGSLSKHLVLSCPPYKKSPKENLWILPQYVGNPKGSACALVPLRENVAKAVAQYFGIT